MRNYNTVCTITIIRWILAGILILLLFQTMFQGSGVGFYLMVIAVSVFNIATNYLYKCPHCHKPLQFALSLKVFNKDMRCSNCGERFYDDQTT